MKIIFATLFLCCSFVGPASASLLANNLSEPTAGPTGISTDSWRAQAFSTTASAFTVTDIAVLFNNPHNSPGVFSMSIYDRDGADGGLGTNVSQIVTDGLASLLPTTETGVFTISNLTITLTPSHKYFLELQASNIFDEDAGFYLWNTSSSSGVGFPSEQSYRDFTTEYSWTVPSELPYNIQMSITASDTSAVPEPSTYALLCISLGVVGYARMKMVNSEG